MLSDEAYHRLSPSTLHCASSSPVRMIDYRRLVLLMSDARSPASSWVLER